MYTGNTETIKATDTMNKIKNQPNLSMRKWMTRVYDELLSYDDVVYIGKNKYLYMYVCMNTCINI